MRNGNQREEHFPSEECVRKGCLISLLLFNVIGETIMGEVKAMLPDLDHWRAGVKCEILYADDTTLVEKPEPVWRFACAVESISLDFRLKINGADRHFSSIQVDFSSSF